ncbi:MAG TPA: VWA domain-containing protein [Terriglobia bacterium]
MIYRRRSRGAVAKVAALSLLLGGGVCIFLWTAGSGKAQDPATPEVTSHESQPAFEMHVQRNEVVVRVVVRDAKGHPVGGLRKDDFQVFDNRKPQVITHFALETSGAAPGKTPSAPAGAAALTNGGTGAPGAIILPHRFMALYFDDVHLEFPDLARTRDAADHYLASNLEPGDRAGIFTSSGQNQVDFTADRDQLHDAILRLRPRPIFPQAQDPCPEIYPYQAFKIIDQNDVQATNIAVEETYQCNCVDKDLTGMALQQCQQQAPMDARSLATQSLEQGLNQTQYALRGLAGVCRRLATLPGQRSVVLVSPGFITATQLYDVDRIADEALRQNVVISTLDARGLYVIIPLGDASKRVEVIPDRPDLMGQKSQIQIESLGRDADVLESLADDTGGVYFHNSNDFGDGFRRVGSFPEAYYVLAFAPQDLKLDGRLHTLKVSLANNPSHLTVQARHGYFAPNKTQDAATVAKEQMEQVIFSQEELQTIPIEVHTQFFKADSGQAKLSVLTHVDIRSAHFRKAAGRNLDNLIVVTALFDQAGNYVTGEQKLIEFHLLDSTLQRLSQTGLNMKASLPVKSGAYLVREVVQESEGDQLSALNSQVEIP